MADLPAGRPSHPVERALEACSRRSAEWVGSSWAFAVAVVVVVAWAVSGPLFHFSDTWQLVINTGTTIVTFLMVFLIQRAQNKDAAALHLKLNEVVAALSGASNRLINVEDLSEEDVRALHRHYGALVALAERNGKILDSHSVEDAKTRHQGKRSGRPRPSSPDA